MTVSLRIQILTFAIVTLFASYVSNARGEQTGTPRKVIAADYSTKKLAIVNEKGDVEWEYPIGDIHDLHVLPGGNLLFQLGWTKVVEVSPEKKIVWQYDAAKQNGNEGKPVEVHAFQRLANGHTMIAESGVGRIIEVDAEGKLQHEFPLTLNKHSKHRDTRLVRKLETGNYLVAHEGDGMVREYNATGKVVWQYEVKTHLYSAARLENGNTLIGTGGGNQVIEVNPQGETVWSLSSSDLDGVKLAWITMVERLPSGNTLVVNCHAGPENPQIIEVTPEKKIVWSFKDFKTFGNALPVARVLPAN